MFKALLNICSGCFSLYKHSCQQKNIQKRQKSIWTRSPKLTAGVDLAAAGFQGSIPILLSRVPGGSRRFSFFKEMRGSATCYHSGIRAKGLGGLRNRGAQAAPPVPQAKSAAAPPPAIQAPWLSEVSSCGPGPQRAACRSGGRPGGGGRSTGSLAPPPGLRGRGLVQPARFWAERVRGSSPRSRRLPDSCEPSGGVSS